MHRLVAGVILAVTANACCSSTAMEAPSTQDSFKDLDDEAVSKLEEAAVVARSPALRAELQRLLTGVPAFDHKTDAADSRSDDGATAYRKLAAAMPGTLAFEAGRFWPWSAAVAEDGTGEVIKLNRRRVPHRSAEAYVGTVWHEVAHKAGYRHAGNEPEGNACTVPNVAADAAMSAAHRVATGSWGALDAQVCPDLRTAQLQLAP